MMESAPTNDYLPVKDKDLVQAYVGELESGKSRHSFKYIATKYTGVSYAAKKLKERKQRRKEMKRLSSSNKVVEQQANLARTRNDILRNELKRQKMDFRKQRLELESQLEQLKEEMSVQGDVVPPIPNSTSLASTQMKKRKIKVIPQSNDPPGLRVDWSGRVISSEIDETKAEEKSSSYPLTLLQGDFCPFANRAQIALLEKEADPENPTLFEQHHVCFQMGPEKDEGTEWLYSLGHKTVPVLIDNDNGGDVIPDSMAVVEYVDDLYPDHHPLQPSNPLMKKTMQHYLDRYNGLPGSLFKLLMAQDPIQQQPFAASLLEELTTLDHDLQEYDDGPFFCGAQFTIADIQIFPFVERIIHVLGYYRQFVIPDELVHVHQWYKAIIERPSVRITTADRDETSMNIYCMTEQKRKDYLIEIYEPYANNEASLAKEMTIELGAPGFNPYREHKRKQAQAEKNEEEEKSSFSLTLLSADFCPFANRALIALLEKEADPENPAHFDMRHVCYQMGPKKDPGTEWLYSLDQKTVPVLIDNGKEGKVIPESMDVVEYVDALYPEKNPLRPSDPSLEKKMKLYMDRHGSLIGGYYKLLMMQDSDQQQSLAEDLLRLFSKLDIDLQVCPGPYLCGEEFTMVDIQIFPFVERIVHVLGHFREFVIPEELVHVHQWYTDVIARPSVRITTADRCDESMNTYCMVEKERGSYLIETYEAYANDEVALATQLTVESGAPGINPYAEFKRKEASYPLMLLHADFCPFSARALIALLEKERDPLHPINFRKQHVCYPLGPDNDRGTKILYSLGMKEVPTLVDNEAGGEAMPESMDVIEHLDDLYPDINPLQPSEADKHEKMEQFINRYDKLTRLFHSVLFLKDPSQKESIAEEMLNLLKSLDNDLQLIPGPYLCGDQFTLADIQIFPFMERIQVVLSHFRGFVIPENFVNVHKWFKAVYDRPSIRAATGDRDEESMSTYRMSERSRREFLIESYECYAAYNTLGRWESIRARNSTSTFHV